MLAWTKALNKQDNKGKTPIHQAVEQINKYHTLRPIKEMLIKGSSRDIKDIDGKKPVDLIDPYGYAQQAELQQILGKQPITIPCCQFKTPLKKLERSYTSFSVYVLLQVVTFTHLQLFVFPFEHFNGYIFYVNSLFLFVNIMFLMASFKSPGLV